MRGRCISVEPGHSSLLMAIGELDEMAKAFCVLLSKTGVHSGTTDRSGFLSSISTEQRCIGDEQH